MGILSEGENVAGMKEEAIRVLTLDVVWPVKSPEKTFPYKQKGLEPTFNANKKNTGEESQPENEFEWKWETTDVT